MKKADLKFKRVKTKLNKITSVLLSSAVFFVSCTANYDSDVTSNVVDGELLRNLHHSLLINDVKGVVYEEVMFRNSKNPEWENLEIEYLKNLEYVNEHGLNSLLEKNEIDPQVIKSLEFYECNKKEPDVYKRISNNFELSYSDAVFLFKMIEIYKCIEDEFNIVSPCGSGSDYQTDGISWGCALAIAGTLTLTVSAIWITGGAALIVFIVSKGLATASLIEACDLKR